MITSIINTSHSEPNQDIIKITSHMLCIKIKLFKIDRNNYVVLTYGPENNRGMTSLISSSFSQPQYSLLLKNGDNQLQEKVQRMSMQEQQQEPEMSSRLLPPIHPESYKVTMTKESMDLHSQLFLDNNSMLKESQRQYSAKQSSSFLNENRQMLKDSQQQVASQS